MKIFIFGAGASNGSIDHKLVYPSKIPPLVDQLFDVSYANTYAKEVGLLPATLKEYKNEFSKNTSLEKWLTDWWDSIPSFPDEKARSGQKSAFVRLTQYFWYLFQSVLGSYDGNNVYRLLLKKISKKREIAGFINFNYDTLFDKALQEIDGVHLIGSMDNYTDARYVKPHGSVNWFLQRRGTNIDPDIGQQSSFDPIVRFNLMANRMFLAPFTLDKLHIADPDDSNLKSPHFIHDSRFSNQYAYPLLFVPLTEKLYDVVTGFYERILTDGRNLLSQATDIYLIGYRANDKIIKDLFFQDSTIFIKDKTKLHIVSRDNPKKGTSAKKLMENILSWSIPLTTGYITEGTCCNEGFKKFVENY